MRASIFVLLTCLVANAARAEVVASVEPEQSAAAPPDAPAHASGPFGDRPFAVGVVVGYGKAIDVPAGVELEPLHWAFGLRFDYDFTFGLRLGAYGDYALGDAVTGEYQVLDLERARVTATVDSQLWNFGVSVGYDQAVGPVVIRYALDIGITYLTWDMGDTMVDHIYGYARTGGQVGPHMAPGLGVFAPLDRYYVGIEYRYWIQFGDLVPPGVMGFAHGGVRW